MTYKKTSPKPIRITPVEHYQNIDRLLFCPSVFNGPPDNDSEVIGQTRTYQTGQYLSISSDGILNFWTNSIDNPQTTALYDLKKDFLFRTSRKCVLMTWCTSQNSKSWLSYLFYFIFSYFIYCCPIIAQRSLRSFESVKGTTSPDPLLFSLLIPPISSWPDIQWNCLFLPLLVDWGFVCCCLFW